jgi:hypothetical protein
MRNSLQPIRVEPTIHRGKSRLKLIFDYDKDLIAKVRKIDDCRWSATMGCWHVPDNPTSKKMLSKLNLQDYSNIEHEKPIYEIDKVNKDELECFINFLKYKR